MKINYESKAATREQAWLDLWQRVGAKGNGRKVYVNLMARYQEPHRHYHTIAHLDDCLFAFEKIRDLANKPDAVEMALWYHDAVYDSKAHENEENSRELFDVMAKNANLPKNYIKQVAGLILATKHARAPRSEDARLIVDIDLSVLGKPAKIFAQYEWGVRREYAWVPKIDFAKGRTALLQTFLARKFIYSTKYCKNRLEKRARRNLAESIRKLSHIIK